MRFIEDTVGYLRDISEWFWSLYVNVPDYGWLTSWIKAPLLWLSDLFWDLCTPFSLFNAWLDDVAAKVGNILSSVDIISLLQTWLTKADNAWDWVRNAPTKVFGLATDWWNDPRNPIRPFVDGLIAGVNSTIQNVAKGLDSLHTTWDNFWTLTWPQWMKSFNSLSTAWTNFLTVIFPTLVDVKWAWEWWAGRAKEVSSLIDSRFKEAAPLWEGWSVVRTTVVTFISNPLDWIKERVIEPIIDDFNKGFDRGMKG